MTTFSGFSQDGGKSNLLAVVVGIIISVFQSLKAFAVEIGQSATTLASVSMNHTLDVIFYASVGGASSLLVKLFFEWIVGLFKKRSAL